MWRRPLNVAMGERISLLFCVAQAIAGHRPEEGVVDGSKEFDLKLTYFQ